jgi:hypothetical protein
MVINLYTNIWSLSSCDSVDILDREGLAHSRGCNGCKWYVLYIYGAAHIMGHFPEGQHNLSAAVENHDFVLALISKPSIRIA